jgi:hypothetical protein
MASATAGDVPSFGPAACQAVASPASPSGTPNRFGGTLSRARLAYLLPSPRKPGASRFFSPISDVADPPLAPTDHCHNHPISQHQANSPLADPPSRPRFSRREARASGRNCAPRISRPPARRGAAALPGTRSDCPGWRRGAVAELDGRLVVSEEITHHCRRNARFDSPGSRNRSRRPDADWSRIPLGPPRRRGTGPAAFRPPAASRRPSLAARAAAPAREHPAGLVCEWWFRPQRPLRCPVPGRSRPAG